MTEFADPRSAPDDRDARGLPIVLERRLGATALADELDLPPWKWPAR